jgi:hypothetical protein
MLVLWNACRGVAPGEDAGWARARVEQLATCEGIAAIALHPVIGAGSREQPPCSWCLELRVADDRSPGELIRLRPWRDFLGDLRLLGMHPRVLAIAGEL